jgi:hypothetical protein
VRVKDPETGRRRRIALTRRTRRRYTAAMDARRGQLTDAFYAAGMDHAFLVDRSTTNERAEGEPLPGTSAVLEPLMELFSARRRAS